MQIESFALPPFFSAAADTACFVLVFLTFIGVAGFACCVLALAAGAFTLGALAARAAGAFTAFAAGVFAAGAFTGGSLAAGAARAFALRNSSGVIIQAMLALKIGTQSCC